MVIGFAGVALAAALGALTLGPGFVIVDEKQGVRVFRREAGHALELGAEGIIAAPPEAVRRVLLDYANAPRWVKSVAESRVVAAGKNSLDVYQRLGLPVIADRDFTLHVTWGEGDGRLWLRFAAQNQLGPPPMEGVVRVSVHEGEWQLEPIDGGKKTHAVYRLRLDLAGSVPSWLGKGRAAKELPALFHGLEREAAAPMR